ncbi:MAG: hypothetical protein MSD82_13685, partial [Prevotella sp.]|nr:hypothetical protein [Prevotella sp.]
IACGGIRSRSGLRRGCLAGKMPGKRTKAAGKLETTRINVSLWLMNDLGFNRFYPFRFCRSSEKPYLCSSESMIY